MHCDPKVHCLGFGNGDELRPTLQAEIRGAEIQKLIRHLWHKRTFAERCQASCPTNMLVEFKSTPYSDSRVVKLRRSCDKVN